MRLFCAIPFPPDVRAALAAYQRQLREAGAAGNFTRPENLHLTLAFLGETGAVRPAAKALAAAADRAFPLTLAGSGRFGDVFWVGVRPWPELCSSGCGMPASPWRTGPSGRTSRCSAGPRCRRSCRPCRR